MAEHKKPTRKSNAKVACPAEAQDGRDEGLGTSGVYPMSGPHPRGDAAIIPPATWG